MKKVIITLGLLTGLSATGWAQISGPATVVAGQSGTWTLSNAPINNSYSWSPDTVSHLQTGLTATTVSGAKLGANATMTEADYPSIWFDPVANRWFAFAVSHGISAGGNNAFLHRLDLGNNPTPSNLSATNQVTSVSLATYGIPGSTGHNGVTMHAVAYDPDQKTWHLFYFRYDAVTGAKMNRIDFGNSLANNPTVANAVEITAPQGFQGAQSKFVRTQNGEYILFVGNRWGGPVRYNFGTNIRNTAPTYDQLPGALTIGSGNVGRSSAMDIVQQNGNWFLFCSTTDAAGTNGHELWRYEFGSNLAGAPTAIAGLGLLPNANHWGLQIVPSACGGQYYGFINARGNIYRLNFGANLTNTPTNELIGTPNTNGLPAQGDISGLFAYTYGDSLYALLGGRTNNGLYSIRLPYNYANTQTLTNKYPGDNTYTHTYNTPGTYRVSVGVNLNGGGAATYCHTVTVTPSGPAQPGMYTAAPSPVCRGQNNVIYAVPAVSGATAYRWYYTGSGANYNDSTSTPTTTLSFNGTATSGTLRVWAVNNNGDSSSLSRDAAITVNVLPTVSISPATVAICAGQSATLTASGATTYSWSPAGGSAATANVAPTATTIYTVTGTSNGCSTTATREVEVHALPTVSISPATVAICAGQSATLTASGANTYVWTPSVGNAATVSVTPATTITYTVEGTNTATGCKNTATRQVTVHTLPVTQVTVTGGVTEVCAGDSVLLSASGTGYNYIWKNEATGATVGNNQAYAAFTTGSYKVVATDAGTGCSDSTRAIDVHVYDHPVVSLDQNDTSFCIGGIVTLEVNTQDTGLTYIWKRDNTTVPLATADFLEISESGSYKVIVARAAVAACEDSTNEVTVTVHDLPVVDIVWDGALLHATPGYASYQWNISGQGVPGATDSTYSPTSAGSYTVKVVDANGCENTSAPQLVDRMPEHVGTSAALVSVQVYPNPSDGMIYITAPVQTNIEIYATDGRLLALYQYIDRLDLNNYAAGMYLLRVKGLNGQLLHVERIIKK